MNLNPMFLCATRAAACFRCQGHTLDPLRQAALLGRAPVVQARYLHDTTRTCVAAGTVKTLAKSAKASKPLTADPKPRGRPKGKATPHAKAEGSAIEGAITPKQKADVAVPEASSSVITAPNQFIYVGVDGDACQFHQDIIVRGRKGGWQAAERLIAEIKNIFALKKDDPTTVIVQIFVNQRGHKTNGWRQFRVHQDVSTAFFEGLNEADPLLNVVNAGSGKEATDVKVKGGMEFHIKLAECKKVALAGLSDGAYASMLKTFITRGQREKVVILKTSGDIANIKDIAEGFGQEPADAAYAIPLVPLPEDLFQDRPLRRYADE